MLGRRTIALLLVSLLTLGGCAFLLYSATAASIEDRVATNLEADARTYHAVLQERLNGAIGEHDVLAAEFDGVNIADEGTINEVSRALLTTTSAQSNGIVSINVIRTDGVPVSISGNLPEISPAVLERAATAVTFGSVVRSTPNDARLVIAGPLRDGLLLVLEQDFAVFERLLGTYHTAGSTTEAVLTRQIGANQQLLSVPRFVPNAVVPRDPSDAPQLPTQPGEVLFNEATDYRGARVLVATAGFDLVDWTLSVKIDRSEAREPLATLRRNLFLSFGALVALAGVPGIFLSARYRHRLEMVTSAVRSLRNGELDARVDDTSGDQIGRLAMTIDEMAERLADDRVARTVAETDLADQALRDSLTGLPNRVAFMRHLDELLSDAEPRTVAVLFCDLDGFKAVNDGIGHSAGDNLLTEVAHRFRKALRRNDYLARFGGDEFILVCPATGDLKRPQALAGRLEEELQETIGVGPIGIDANVSIGIAINGAGDSVDTIVRNADIAMYRIKQQRKSAGIVETTDRLYGASGHDAELQRAIAEDQMRLLYQPIVDLSDNRIVGVEALVRWHHPMLGLLNPDSFLPRADRSGLLGQLDFWVFERACHQAAAWAIAGRIDETFTMSINLSPAQLSNPALREHIADTIERHDVKPEILQIEITEHSLVIEDPRVATALDELRDIGIRLAIDDFGTLHANLDRVKRIRARTLKIDQSFVANIATDTNDRAIVEAVLQMGAALDIKTVAEGIESPEQARILAELGCGFGQGFYFGNPRSPDATAHLLAYGLIGLPT